MNTTIAYHGEFIRPNGGPCLFFTHSEGFRIQGYAATGNGAIVHVRTTARDLNTALHLDLHCEKAGLQSCIEFQGDPSQTVRGFRFKDFAPQAAAELFKAGAGVTNLAMPNLRISVERPPVFSSGDIFDRGIFAPSFEDIYVPGYQVSRATS